MASTTLYYTGTEALTDQTVLSGGEVLLAFAAPASGDLAWSEVSSSNILIGSTPAGQPGEAGSWDAMTGVDCQLSVDVSVNSGVTLGSVTAFRMNASLAEQAQDWMADTGWSSTTGTGVKVYTPGETIELGTAGATDRYSMVMYASGSSASLTIDLGTDSWVEVPWAITDVPLYAVSPTDDVTTTGWTSTPLWSKIDDDPDSPDATVITATAS